MGSLVSGQVCLVRGMVFCSWVVSSGTSYSVADEALVVLNVFGALGGGEIDPIYLHCHWIFGSFLWSRVGGDVAVVSSQFLHTVVGIKELSCFMEPDFVASQFFKEGSHFEGYVGGDCFS